MNSAIADIAKKSFLQFIENMALIVFQANGKASIGTPFLDSSNDHIVIHVWTTEDCDEYMVIEDDVMFELRIRGYGGEYDAVIDNALAGSPCDIKRGAGGIYATVEKHNIGEAIWWVAHAVAEIYHKIEAIEHHLA